MTELLINEVYRRGLLDAFLFRSPSVSVQAGKLTQAATSCLSGMIREARPERPGVRRLPGGQRLPGRAV